MLCSVIPIASADDADKRIRNLYIHAQGENPTATVTGSTIYTDEAADIYFAVDDPNKGLFEDGEHKEPQYDMNGYSVTIYYDPAYFELADGVDAASPIDCTVPSKNTVSEGEDCESGYYLYRHGGESGISINGKSYNSAYVTVLFSGIYLPQKEDGTLWYNLCKLPLKPKKTGSTQVFFDTEGRGNYISHGQMCESLELFAKDESGELENQTFRYNVVNGGYHNITIKDRTRPGAPTADPGEGSYTEVQHVKLSAERGCEIWYSTDGGSNYYLYDDSTPIEIVTTTTIICYAKRTTDGKTSSEVSYTYKIIPKAPHLFIDESGTKTAIPNVYSEYSAFGVYASDKEIFGNIEDTNKVYYTFSDISDESVTGGNDPESEWVEIQKSNPYINIDKKRTVRLITVNMSGEKSDVSEYHLGVKPAKVTADKPSGDYDKPIDVTLETPTQNAVIYYTTDGSDPLTSGTRKKAQNEYSTALITINDYTVVKAVVIKDGTIPSRVVTQTYDIVNKKPARPLTTLTPGNYIRKIGDDVGFSTKFMPVPTGTEIYYTISYDGTFKADPIPNTAGTIQYDKQPITVKGHTIIKAAAVNAFGVKSDVGIFEYIITPEAPKAAPSAAIGGDKLPVVPVNAVKGCTVIYEINGFENRFDCREGSFYIDTATGNAYEDEACTKPLGTQNTGTITAPAELNISAELDGIASGRNRYIYKLEADSLAPPYADKETGEYEEIKADENDSLLLVKLYSLNENDEIWYTTDNGANWIEYTGAIPIKNDTVLQIQSKKDGKTSKIASYVYNFVPLAPIITLPSGRYLKSENPSTMIELDSRAPSKDYTIWYRENGGKQDVVYQNQRRYIDHTMSFKAYVKNNETGRVSKNAINYYIIEPEGAATGRVFVGTPYDVSRISADVLDTGEYANGIKLKTHSSDTVIHYFYTYTREGLQGSVKSPDDMVYDNMPIMVNKTMTAITITAWLTDRNGNEITGSKEIFPIEFVHLQVPKTSLGSDKVEFPKGTSYTIINDYPDDKNILLYYTTDGSEPSLESNEGRKLYSGETLALNEAVTVKAVYLSVCGKCVYCKDDKPEMCTDKVYGKTGVYKYTVPTVIRGGGGGGGMGRTTTIDNTRKYTKDIFGSEHPTHIGYINGYPDGSVKPDGEITREEMTSILYRIVNHDYEKPFIASGDVFPDVSIDRWSTHDIEYMSDKDIVYGYPDGEFKPGNNLTRAEFAALIKRFAKLEETDKENPFPDLDESHWAYDDILSLNASGLMQGYEDGTYRPENQITRAEVMIVINKILGRNPSEMYVKSLGFNPFNDLEKDKWHYIAVLEATITHNYYLDDNGVEIKWEDCK